MTITGKVFEYKQFFLGRKFSPAGIHAVVLAAEPDTL
jgi:hypothetical protein